MTQEEIRVHNNIDTLCLSIIVTQLSLHYNEKLKRGGHHRYKHNLKKFGNLFIKELIKAEEDEFDKLLDSGEETITSQTEEIQDALELLQQKGFVDFKILTKFNMAAKYDQKRIMGLVNKIIKEHE